MPIDAAENAMTPLVVAHAEQAAEDIRLYELRDPAGPVSWINAAAPW